MLAGLSSGFFSPNEGWFVFPNMLVAAVLCPAGILEGLVAVVLKLENILLSGLILSVLSASVVFAAPKREGAGGILLNKLF